MFENIYKNKKVLITGNTGFKGTWLTTWLLKLGAKIVGFSKDVPTTPSAFELLKLRDKITHYQEDIRNLDKIKLILNDERPDFIFHLAAQAIVSQSYQRPLETLETNILGTANILEALRSITWPCTAILITSDKCYENVEWCWGYKENDRLGGKDIYSASKGAAELIFHAYHHSFLPSGGKVRLATARAGNVIGGGDWAQDRIVADCFRAWSKKLPVSIRNPQATRPWQHVLEPLSGYLHLGWQLNQNIKLHGESYNFGPRAEQNQSVETLLKDLSKKWGHENISDAYKVLEDRPFHEACLLKLNCDKALFDLKWNAAINYTETVTMVSNWYGKYYKQNADMFACTLEQIEEYEILAQKGKVLWSQN
ncbi:MAG: CDP-glucose 4,6-dehydratase [Bdellovibrionales bacterium GWA2_49_15]|nr:MAG: CDP-glucose 4,6-dehydratase [Bdellovibrionales bacterium GWA2_49_15]HAZ11711.1 CDP-glucose 4,6-dehydratase [Bdellovibrionales bacterium]